MLRTSIAQGRIPADAHGVLVNALALQRSDPAAAAPLRALAVREGLSGRLRLQIEALLSE